MTQRSAYAGTVVIVDPFSTGAELAPEFRRHGWRTIAVSRPRLPAVYVGKLQAADFDHVVVHKGDLRATVKTVSAFRPDAVVAGTEIGVVLADALSQDLDLPGNGTAASRSRRHKATMSRAVSGAGLAVPIAFEVGTAEEALEAAACCAGPVVVKPVDSAGGDGVRFCKSLDEVRDAFAAVHGQINLFGGVNRTVLVQEWMIGEQFFVNTVSKAGRHRIIEVWADRRQRRPEGVVCDREDLLPATGSPQGELVAYVRRTLDALEIREGPAHTELMITPGGVRLIECAARMQGTIVPDAVSAARGENHVTATVGAVVDPDAFAAVVDDPYKLLAHVSVVSLIAPRPGKLSARSLAALHETETLHSVFGELTPGAPVVRTVDLFSSPGFLYLVADDTERIEADYRRIRALEQNGLYG